MTEEMFQTKVLGDVGALTQKITDLQNVNTVAATDTVALKKASNDLTVELNKFRAEQDSLKRALARTSRKPGQVSDECARHLFGFAMACGLIGGKFQGEKADKAENIVKDIIGNAFDMKFRTALASSDIPLPVIYSGEVAELVSEYGAARKYGTVFPLGSGSVKLPYLKTDTTFTVLAQSTAITQKSPQTDWVTFTPEKFGGLILLPAEIDADSIVPMGQFLAKYAARNIARVEDWNFFRGTGTVGTVNGDVEGLAISTITNSKVNVSGTTAAASEFTLTQIRGIRALVDAPAMLRGAYYMHPSMEQLLSTFNTSGNTPYRANGLGGATLDGWPVYWVDVMPVYKTADAVSTVHILFGDLSYQYLGVRGGPTFATSIECGFDTDDIYIRAMERFTIGLMNVGAVSGLETYSS